MPIGILLYGIRHQTRTPRAAIKLTAAASQMRRRVLPTGGVVSACGSRCRNAGVYPPFVTSITIASSFPWPT